MEKKIADNKELIRQTTVCRKTKPTYDGLKKARKPERYWEENRAGLALFEAAGRKTYLAGCIANALMEQEVPVRMANFAAILNDLTGTSVVPE